MWPYSGRGAGHSRAVIVEALVDPYEPPMPPSVTVDQASKFAESLVRGEPNRKRYRPNLDLGQNKRTSLDLRGQEFENVLKNELFS
jgi:hypothetical protein